MKTSKAGTQLANINHTGKGLCSPKGLIIQPLWSGLDTIRPFGTTNFCTEKDTSFGQPDLYTLCEVNTSA